MEKSFKVKPGDVITVVSDNVRDQFKQKGNFEDLVIETKTTSEKTLGNSVSVLAGLFDASVYKIEENEVHPDLTNFGVNIHHYSLRASEIETFAKIKNRKGDVVGVKVNGDIDIYFEGEDTVNLSDAHFLNERQAQEIATALNSVETDRMCELEKLVSKGKALLQSITDSARV